jgi:D-alanyl-D-alanine carboxypeptidase
VRYEFDPAFLQALRAEPAREFAPEEELAFLLDTEAPFAAGAGWDYSDTNYVLLGLVLERVGGAPLDELIARRLLRPLALQDTTPSDGRELPGLVQGHAGAGNGFLDSDVLLGADGRMLVNPQFEGAGGGYVTTALDLARWAVALHAEVAGERAAGARVPVIPGGLRAEMLAGVPAPLLGPGARYGLGVILREGPLGEVRGHSGFFPGWQSEMQYYPRFGFAVAMQCNSSEPGSLARPLGAVLRGLAAIVAQELEAPASR